MTVDSSEMDTVGSFGTSGAGRERAIERRRVVPKMNFMVVFVVWVVLISWLMVVEGKKKKRNPLCGGLLERRDVADVDIVVAVIGFPCRNLEH